MTGDNFIHTPKEDWQVKEIEEGLSRVNVFGYLTAVILFVALILLFLFCNKAQAQNIPCPAVDLDIIATIESSNNPLAYNKKSGAVGMYQITPICLKEYNAYHRGKEIALNGLYSPQVARLVADWYINHRIPQMLRFYGLNDNITNRLWGYNAGIGRVKQGFMPEETRNYIAKYERMVNK